MHGTGVEIMYSFQFYDIRMAEKYFPNIKHKLDVLP